MAYRYFLCFCFALFTLGFSQSAAAVVSSLQFFADDDDGIDSLRCIDDIAETSNGRFVYVISACDDAINLFERNESNTYDFVSAIVNDEEQQGISPNEFVLISPDDQNLYVAGSTRNGDEGFRRAIFVYDLDPSSGSFVLRQVFDDFTIFGDDYNAVMTSDGRHMYMITVDGELIAISRSANGVLSRIQSFSGEGISSSFVNSERLFAITLTPDESEVIISANPQHIVRFRRDSSSGLLTNILDTDISELESFVANTDARSFTFSPDGNDLYTNIVLGNSSRDDQLVQFTPNESGGFDVGQLIGPDLPETHPNSRFFCPKSPLVSENGRLLYLIDACSNDIQVWGRDLLSGELSFFGLSEGGENGFVNRAFSQLENARFSNDGRYIFGATVAGFGVIDISVDIQLDVSELPESVDPEQQITLSIDIENSGGATSHNTEIRITTGDFNVGSASISGSRAECTTGDAMVVCSIFEIAPDAAERVTLSLQSPSEAGEYALEISSSQDQVDISEDNTLTISTEVTEPTEEEHIEEEPAEEEPVEEEPVEEEPVSDEPAEEEPLAEELVQEDTPTPNQAESSDSSGGGSSEYLLLGLLSLFLFRRRRA